MKNKAVILAIFIVIAIIGIVLYNKCFEKLEKYTITNGSVEKISDVQGYVLRDETQIPISDTDVLSTVKEEFSRVSKDEIVAVYKNSIYESYSERIQKMDNEIQTLVNDLPAIYSGDVTIIDNEISKLVELSSETTSYVKMQEYKTKIDELSYDKVITLGKLSPSGSKISELIEERKKLEEQRTNASNSVKASKSGIVSYKVDSAEGLYNKEDALNYSVTQLDSLIETYSNNKSSKFGIKIINNYSAYIVTKIAVGDNDEYINENKVYNIRITDTGENLSAILVKNIVSNGYNYSIFQINNGIEKLTDQRMLGIQVIWNKFSGLAVIKEAVKSSEDGKYSYVSMIVGMEYIDVPVKIIAESDSICIIDNYKDEELKALGIESKYKIERHDQIVLLSDT